MKYACSILLFVACPVLQNFTTLFHERHDFRKDVIENKTRFLFINFLYKFCRNFSYCTRNWGRYGLRVKYLLFLSDFNETWTPSTDIGKIIKYRISWNSVLWEPSCSMRTDGRKKGHTERLDENNSGSSQFCERAYKLQISLLCNFLSAVIHFLLFTCFLYSLHFQNTWTHWCHIHINVGIFRKWIGPSASGCRLIIN